MALVKSKTILGAGIWDGHPVGYLFVLPFGVLFIRVRAGARHRRPAYRASPTTILLQTPQFVGLTNYEHLIHGRRRRSSSPCKNTLVFACIAGPVGYILVLPGGLGHRLRCASSGPSPWPFTYPPSPAAWPCPPCGSIFSPATGTASSTTS